MLTVVMTPRLSGRASRRWATRIIRPKWLVLALVFLFLILAPVTSRATPDATVVSTGQFSANLLIIPQPKSVRRGAGMFIGKHDTEWRLQGPERDERLWQAAGDLLDLQHGKFLTNQAGFCLEIGGTIEHAFQAETNEPWAANPEGYHLLVTTNEIVLAASTAQGVFYGLQTLGQIRETDSQKFSCPAVEIKDWPALRFRGVHWFPSASGTPMYRQLIDSVFSTLKFNHCVVQCEAARWDSHPEIAMTNSISKADLRRLVEECRRRFIEPIPLVDVPGHADWMFRHHQNSNLVEDPETPYACCVRNPRTVKLIEDVMTECLDVFHPQTFHLGFDEITLRGRFPNPECPFCHDATATTLMTESANRLAGWLAARGIATMMWGDMLLGPGEAVDATSAATVTEAKLRRTALSKNITITDWHYVWNADSTSLNALQGDGFHTIAATWEEPVNIFRFSQAAIASGSDGLLQTTWDGYFPDQREIKRELDQFAAYVIAADYAWSGRSDPPANLGYDAREIFQRAYQGKFGWPGKKNLAAVN